MIHRNSSYLFNDKWELKLPFLTVNILPLPIHSQVDSGPWKKKWRPSGASDQSHHRHPWLVCLNQSHHRHPWLVCMVGMYGRALEEPPSIFELGYHVLGRGKPHFLWIGVWKSSHFYFRYTFLLYLIYRPFFYFSMTPNSPDTQHMPEQHNPMPNTCARTKQQGWHPGPGPATRWLAYLTAQRYCAARGR